MNAPNECLLAFSTFPDLETARRVARQIVDEHLAACANILSSVESIYHWRGQVEESSETMVIFKLSSSGFAAFETKLQALHPYDIPEIIAAPVAAGLPAYLDWVTRESAARTTAP